MASHYEYKDILCLSYWPAAKASMYINYFNLYYHYLTSVMGFKILNPIFLAARQPRWLKIFWLFRQSIKTDTCYSRENYLEIKPQRKFFKERPEHLSSTMDTKNYKTSWTLLYAVTLKTCVMPLFLERISAKQWLQNNKDSGFPASDSLGGLEAQGISVLLSSLRISTKKIHPDA